MRPISASFCDRSCDVRLGPTSRQFPVPMPAATAAALSDTAAGERAAWWWWSQVKAVVLTSSPEGKLRGAAPSSHRMYCLKPEPRAVPIVAKCSRCRRTISGIVSPCSREGGTVWAAISPDSRGSINAMQIRPRLMAASSVTHWTPRGVRPAESVRRRALFAKLDRSAALDDAGTVARVHPIPGLDLPQQHGVDVRGDVLLERVGDLPEFAGASRGAGLRQETLV